MLEPPTNTVPASTTSACTHSPPSPTRVDALRHRRGDRGGPFESRVLGSVLLLGPLDTRYRSCRARPVPFADTGHTNQGPLRRPSGQTKSSS